ncbi:polymer-forming cytoskeletal protein [Thermomicrobium sp. 4228-Ro]|uniref:bactofilin family protein n=1 Tax=Thermomicrobium sp. 4228-Ro TaxID=2993937 RepID=UPI00224879B0|nr:polymer-forming cytoskeletal protein [Thermomicrobium sp. 4228-Ro]MCX2727721.1 polymer-forming cytoskeletal protein [Thermomicrobium sp. 4228-Ro]
MVESLTLIDRYTSVDGTLSSSRDIRIEGELRGTLRCEGSVQIAEGARVDATVEAGGITVAGTLRGTIDCRGKLHVLKTGLVAGTITTRLLVIEEGGRCEGELSMTVDPNLLPTASSPLDSRSTSGRMVETESLES